jgi:hypothetical protein
MELDLQVVDGRLIDLRCAALQQFPNQLPRRFEVAAQKLALRAFEPKAEHQFVAAAPISFVEHGHPARKIRARRCKGRRRLGLASGAQVDRGYQRLLVLVVQQRGAPIKLICDIEQMLGEFIRGHARQQRAPDAQVDFCTILFRDQRVSCLLDPIVQESDDTLLLQDKPGVDGFPKGRVSGFLCFSKNQGQGSDRGNVAQAGELFQDFLSASGEPFQLFSH